MGDILGLFGDENTITNINNYLDKIGGIDGLFTGFSAAYNLVSLADIKEKSIDKIDFKVKRLAVIKDTMT